MPKFCPIGKKGSHDCFECIHNKCLQCTYKPPKNSDEVEYQEVKYTTKGLNLGLRSYCSNCGRLSYMHNYCATCGAKVKESN